MKRLFVSAALLPLAYAASVDAETKITTAVTTPVATATAANGQPDDLTIDTAGSVKPTTAGAAVTLNSNNAVKNLGAIAINGLNDSTGILVQGGRTGSVTNSSTITVLEDYTPADSDSDGDLDGPFAQGSNRFAIRLTGSDPFTGDIRNDAAGAISVEGNDSAGIRLDSRLNGKLVTEGAITVIGDRSVGVLATSNVGNVRIAGTISVQGEGSVGVSLGDVTGNVQLQGAISATGYRSGDRLAESVRAKFDADDLKQGGGAVRIAGDVTGGIILDKPPADLSSTNTDEDADGIADASEGTGSLTAFGSAPALDIGSATRATTVRVNGATTETNYGLVLRGDVTGAGVNDGVGATAIRIGQAGGGATTITNGINVVGSKITATAFGADVTAQGGAATAILINAGSVVPELRNSGTITSTLSGGSQDARAVMDLSGSLSSVLNTGVIGAAVSPKTGSSNVGQAVALDLRANTTGATVRQTKLTLESTPNITGSVLFGSGNDRLEILGGTLNGAMAFGAGADALFVDVGATATGRITDSDGRLTISIGEGKLVATNTDTINLTGLLVSAKGVLGVTIDGKAGTATRYNVSGAAQLVSGSKVEIQLASLQRGAKSYEIVRAGGLQAPATAITLAGAPFLYTATLRTDAAANVLYADVRPKTATELGLNRSSSQAFGAVFDALDKNSAIQNLFLAQTTQTGFQQLYNQMLPDHSGGALMTAQAISGQISSAIGQRGGAEGYGSVVWAQEILFSIDRDATDAQGFESQGFGLAGGYEQSGDNQAVGLNVSFVGSDYNDKSAAPSEQVTMNFLEGGAYWRGTWGPLHTDARAGLGYVKFKSDREFLAGGTDLTASADWTGWLAEAHAGVSYHATLGWAFVRPELSADYVRLSEDSYQEAGGGAGFDLKVDKRKGDLLMGQAVVAFGAKFGDDFWWSPEAKVGYRAKLAGDQGMTTASFAGGTPFTLDPEDAFKGGAVARLGVRGGMKNVLYAIDAGGVFDKDYREYDLRAVVRFLF